MKHKTVQNMGHKNGTLNGYGVLRQKLSDKNKMGIYYKGQFKDNAFNGKGSIPDLNL